MNGLTAREQHLARGVLSQLGKADIESAVDKVAERLSSSTPIMVAGCVGELAHGQRQWVEIAMVIVCVIRRSSYSTNLPAGMSDEETQLTAGLIDQLNRSMTVVVVEHDMDFIRQIAKTVTVFHQGRIPHGRQF